MPKSLPRPFEEGHGAPQRPLVDTRRFLLATRETGYRSTTAALAELVDNSLQAGARRIRVFVDTHDCEEVHRIAVLDNGGGMSCAELDEALQFGGSLRFGDRSGLGRFGMGLPNSSVSQARRLDVYSWTRPGDVRHASLDIDEVLAGGVPGRAGGVTPLPEWLCEDVGPHGTLVVWSRCDRLADQGVGHLAASMRTELGRVYRYSLWEGVVITVNGATVSPMDPLFLKTTSGGPRARAFGRPLRYEVRVPTTGEPSVVRVRFSELPVSEWKDRPAGERRASGIVRGAGVSVVRAGREIDYGWHLMGDKRRENYDDWWRCEIAFEPVLDELFGVTHSKQGIRPNPDLVALLAGDLESAARTLNRRVRDAFAATSTDLVGARAGRAERKATRRERTLPQGEFVPGHRRDGGVRSWRIVARELPTGDFFRVEHADGERVLVLNRLHPFYQSVYHPLAVDDQRRFALECLLLSAARAFDTGSSVSESEVLSALRADWSDALAAYLT
ncbi:MAG: hypothetical protein AVDCRST_MAG68-553 [uncultured Gemmatimonadetes bacterium]|uniref:ATP-binding protein n=1 Tax=uncultured Gemmatimonadota bacterium TaxID=203437 RepID=A0A6J4K9T5_9BACT|nr:MAG: hypothetical protein AVDCRST_MAG68-553 [uncultured Gemmatimonadota bacterium]